MSRNKPRLLLIAIAALAMLVVAIVFWVVNSNMMISESKIEQDARKFHSIDSDWSLVQYTVNNISAMLFYPDDMTEHIYSIYVKHPQSFTGYSLRASGTISEIRQDIVRFYLSEYESYVFMSMNTKKVCKITVDDGDNADITLLDENKPFVVIISANAGNIFFYDTSGKSINFIQRSLP